MATFVSDDQVKKEVDNANLEEATPEITEKKQEQAVSSSQPAAVIPTSSQRAVELGKKKRTFKIIVVGDTGVGKTCLTYRFCSGKFPSTPTDATIGVDFREKMITIDNNEKVLNKTPPNFNS
jgi:hypothetical protein